MSRPDADMIVREAEEFEPLLDALERLLPPEDWSRVRSYLTEYVKGRVPVNSYLRRPNRQSAKGERILEERRVLRRRASDKSAVLESGVGVDINRQTQAEAELHRRKSQLRSLALKLAQAEDEERRRIARGLHDSVGPLLALARSRLRQLIVPEKCADMEAEANEVCGLVDEALAEIRSLTFELSSPVLHALGLVAALNSLCEQLEKESEVDFRVEVDGEIQHLDKDLSGLLYQIARELCFNIVRHAQARHAEVRVQADEDEIRVVVTDDGEGFDDPKQVPRFDPSGGFGLFAVQDMSDHIGGSLEIESTPGKGSRATLSVPLR